MVCGPFEPFWRNGDMEEYEHLRQLVETAADDVAKASGGNKAAGTRVRKPHDAYQPPVKTDGSRFDGRLIRIMRLASARVGRSGGP